MVDPISEDDCMLREWAPLSSLLGQIPPKAQRGLFTGDLNFTCIAAIPDYLAIGTNHGLVYWYNRLTNELQRLRCENTMCSITCVSVTSTVDFMIAAGTSTGVVSVFLVPKAAPNDIPDLFKTNSKKQIERYTVGDLHSTPITAIEWSPNGMKLFSGDQKGIIVLTEIDFYMHLSKSVEILNEKYEVVQLSYNSNNQLLLVSTLFRTILCFKNASGGTWKVSQVGNKERKTLGKMGATFFNNSENPRFPVVFCSRPGLRIWTANKDGVVEKTLMFKDSVLGQQYLIPLLNPTKSRGRQSCGDLQLGPLLMFRDCLLVTYTSDALLILDPNSISVVGALYDVQKISALCVTKSEIFILEGERHIMRIGFSPEKSTVTHLEDSASAIGGAITNQFLELTAKIRDASFTSVIPIKKLSPIFSPTRSSGSSDGEQVSECMEAQELPPVLSLDTLDLATTESIPELHVNADSVVLSPAQKEVYSTAQRSGVTAQVGTSLHSEMLDKIGQEQFEEVVFQPRRKIKKIRKKPGVLAKTGTESGSDTTSVVSTTSENDEVWPGEQVDASSEWSNVSVNTSRRSSVDAQSKSENDILKKLETTSGQENACNENFGLEESFYGLALQSISESTLKLSKFENFVTLQQRNEQEIEEALAAKERLLAKKYNLEVELGIPLDDEQSLEAISVVDLDTQQTTNETMPEDDILDSNLTACSEESTLQSFSGFENLKIISDGIESFHDEKITSLSSILSYGPPSGSSQLPSRHSSLDLELPSPREESGNVSLQKEAMEASGWLQFSTPKPTVWLAVSSHYLVAIDNHDTVHYCGLGGLGLKWQIADCKASQLALSPNTSCVWRLHNNVAYALKNPASSGPHGEEWLEVATSVRSIAVADNCAWFISLDGDIFCQKGLSKSSPTSDLTTINKPCEWSAVKIVCFSQIVWLLASTGEVYARLGVSSARPEGVDWKRVNIPIPGSVVDISLGSQRTGWIVDNNDTVMFSVDHMEHEPHWWQVLISDYIFQQTSPLQRLRTTLTKNLRPALPSRHGPISCVGSGKDSVWILQHNSNTLHANKSKITGHSWTKIKVKGSPTSIKWQTVTAEGIFESGGQLWLLSANGDLFCSQPYNRKNIELIPLPTSEGAVCLASSSQALWLLTSSGKIYIRQGLSDTCLEGNNWTELSLVQIEDVHLSHVSCGLDVVWACDTVGNMHMTVSSPHAMATAAFSPVWIRVPDSKEQKKIFFIKVFVGSQTYMVWALDNQGKVYVREAIFPDYPLGLDWVAVTGITALDLSVSATAVWALSVDGDVYRRQGITQNNYIGDYWKKIPGSVEALTASMCDRLWGIDKSGMLLRHTQLTVNLNSGSVNPGIPQALVENMPVGEEGDWEVV
ncbi:tectonin beta-propeller repeat-containing protein 2 [Frankliniella occidentalis]|uniref:Tectonin beta-propeller repeat-containing protein 2 n=1 Tax=Frankliniella occidentalis TaxID=133901 RepID=A0A6J1SJP4_FRAOC|nr:tectonin beta-propeller repeat-containing protein 2 [Frankliniella occidentalis]XP_052124593.1 tectonin beta-propeller repeat-containing protein 2 [Frankliniella occidentalis]